MGFQGCLGARVFFLLLYGQYGSGYFEFDLNFVMNRRMENDGWDLGGEFAKGKTGPPQLDRVKLSTKAFYWFCPVSMDNRMYLVEILISEKLLKVVSFMLSRCEGSAGLVAI